ncbi:hypothetical protein F2P56_001109 [Juglans regia]|uniref:Two-component response regulator ORR21-like isoform X2 n=2 Tax=Juglans regia TaxID=51240 RepID=A0A2I4FGH9_JUGRE|nr:two-component response regulator ORR21-like isoform X2 [Juglans regia]KAF5480350.1 hypothetical protein F2P56_001109 [Juglans regia]
MECEKLGAVQPLSNTQLTPPPIVDIHILVVDDDATSLAIVSAMLRALKYAVVTVRNPLDALATLRMQKFDLVVTDLHMPVMNGFELQKEVEEEFQLPVIMMSADDEESVILKSLENGAAFYMVKPITPNDLKNVWQYAVAGKKGRSAAIEQIRGIRGDSSGDTKLDPKRKAPAKKAGKEDLGEETKKTKVVWTTSLHNRFLQAIRHIGLEKAVPKNILQFMNVPGITRENVASHLQKYRIFLKRVADKGAVASRGFSMSADRYMRSSFASGQLPFSVMQNLHQQQYPKFPEQQQMRASMFQQGGLGGNMRALNAPSTVDPFLFSNRATSNGSSVPHYGFGHSFKAPNVGPVRFPDKQAPSSNFNLPQLGHGHWPALISHQANLREQSFGNGNPLYQANRSVLDIDQTKYNLGSMSLSNGDMAHGLMNAANSLMNGANSIPTYPQQNEQRQGLLTSSPINCNFGISELLMGTANSSNPPPNSSFTNGTSYAGIKLSNEGQLVFTGPSGDHGYGLLAGKNNNIAVAPMGNIGTSGYMTQGGGSSSAPGLENPNQLPPVLFDESTANQHENALLMAPQAQQQYGLSNRGEFTNHYGSDILLNNISTLSGISDPGQQLGEDDLSDLFLQQNINQLPYQCESQVNYDISGSSSCVENMNEDIEENPLLSEVPSLGQNRANEQLPNAVFESNVYHDPEKNVQLDQHSNQQENDRELEKDDDLINCINDQEWPEEEFMDFLFGLGP